MKSQHFEARATFRTSPAALWPLLADTARMNRALGLPPVEYTITPAEGGGSNVEAQVHLFGLPIARYTEHPFRWEAPFGYVVVREFDGGPLRRLRFGTQLTPNEDGTEVVVYTDILPRTALGAELVRRFLGPASVRRVVQHCRSLERYLLGLAEHPFAQLAAKRQLSPGTAGTANQLVLKGLDLQAVELLRRHLAEAADEDVVKMRPFELADRWGLDRRETLALFLHATVVGLLVMTWDVLCPNCRVAKAEHTSLRDLDPQAHCEVCNINFEATFDRSVEVRFSVAPALRQVERDEFCIGGPMNTPHVIAQVGVSPGAVERARCLLAPGSYRLRSPRSRGQGFLEATEAPSNTPGPADSGHEMGDQGAAPRSELAEGQDGRSLAVCLSSEAIEPTSAVVPPGAVQLEIVNRSDLDQLLILEGNLWPDTAATAAYVSTMQEFRDLFSSEALAPGLELAIQTLAFMFTDLTGSTAMYQAIGQARAFRLVQDHFQVLRAAISANSGALVKTIGDAVMATFPGGADALAAAFQIQRDIRGLATPEGVDPARLVKIGLHQGPCVAVTLNDRLDYFGTTVNTAARVEHECRGGQIVASLVVCQSEPAARLLNESGARLEEEVVRLRGIAEPVPVYRITPA